MTKPCCCLGAWLLLVAICCFISWKANAQLFTETDPPPPGYGTDLKQEIAFQLWESIQSIPDGRLFTMHLPAWHRPAVNLTTTTTTTGGSSPSHMNVSMQVLGGMTLVGSQMKANLAQLFITAVQRYCHPSISLAVTLQIRVWLALPQFVASSQVPPLHSQLQNQPSIPNPLRNAWGQGTPLQPSSFQGQQFSGNSYFNQLLQSQQSITPSGHMQSSLYVVPTGQQFQPPSLSGNSLFNPHVQQHQQNMNPSSLHGIAARQHTWHPIPPTWQPIPVLPLATASTFNNYVQPSQTISPSVTPTTQNANTRLQVARATEALVRHVEFRFQDFSAQGNGVELKYTAY